MNQAFGVEEKYRQLRMRREDQRKLGQQIDAIVRQAETSDQPKGCFPGGCFGFLGRMKGRKASARTVEIAASAVNGATSATSNADFSRAVFGLAGVKKGDPGAKLEEAASIMKARIESLEQRAQEHRAQALSMQKSGQRAQAVRTLKKAKQIEAQVASNQASLDAVEQQVDMLAQAAMHKTLTSALASTSKTMKGDAKLLSKAEQAIDDATEARDVANDLNGVMAEFASTGVADVDDDDLMAELEDMIANEPPPPPAVMSEAEKQAEIALLEGKLAERERSKETRAALSAMPAAPTNSMGKKAISKEEKAGLLAGISQSA
tara:strand:+ start:2769 stop:3728 length:960 start_codon:yes stop_codon:yes gene_type:complete